MPTTKPTLSNGYQFWLDTLTGTVVSQTKTSQVSVSQDAATVLTTNTVIPGQVRSSTSVSQELWLQTADGKEQAVTLAGFALPVREGHLVSLAIAGPLGKSGHIFGVRNHATDEMRCDITALGHGLREWGMPTGMWGSLACWTFGLAVALALPAFAVSSGPADNKAAMALGASVLGGFIGLVAWALIGSNLGPGRRLVALLAEIDELGRKALMDVSEPEPGKPT